MKSARTTAALALLFGTATVHAEVIRVPADQPTIQAAVDAAVAGDEVLVAPGIYNEQVDLLGKAITLRSAAGPSMTLITGLGLAGSVVQCVNGEGPDTVIEGFTLVDGLQASFGGGMLIDGASPTVRECVFRDNEAARGGGGVAVLSGSPTLEGCLFDSNDGGTSIGLGGGLYVADGAPVVSDTNFRANTASSGQAIGIEGGDPLLIRCTVEDHIGGDAAIVDVGDGGGATSLVDCLIRDNFLFGVRSDGRHAVKIEGSLLTGHLAFGLGLAADSAVTVSNSIVWGNSSSISDGGGDLTVRFSDIEGGWPGSGNLDVDPQFVDPAGGNYRLADGSPCIDAGDNGSVRAESTLDLDGRPRFVDDPSVADTGLGEAPLVDLGPYEKQPGFALTVTPDPMPAGETVRFGVVAAEPDSTTWIVASFTGRGATFVPQLNLIVNLEDPFVLLPMRTTDPAGDVSWMGAVPFVGEAVDVWFQAVQVEAASNVVETQIVP